MGINKNIIYDIAVIGGGAAGLMSAVIASQSKKSVILIEKNIDLGRKILATGNGRCNLTNRLTNVSRYHGGNTTFIESVLKQFDQFKTIRFFEDLGLVLKEENLGRIFPRTDEAKSVVDALAYELKKNNVEISFNNQVRKLEILKLAKGETSLFKITLENSTQIQAKNVILTVGGQASPQFGSTGDAYFWLKNFGHTITPLYPALTPIETIETWPKEIQGLKIEGKVTATVDSKVVNEKNGDLLFTHFGISGPAAMAQAAAIGPYLNKSDIKIHIDLFPDQSVSDVDEIIKKIIDSNGAKQIKNTLFGLIPSRLAPIILTNLNIDPDKKSAEISKNNRLEIAKTLKNITLTVSNTRSFKEAQVTHGGVNLDEVNSETMESKIITGLYLAGEILDVDGDSGGFNLQWAWSSGHLAGTNASR